MHLRSDYGVIMNHKKIKRIMKKYGLVTKVRRRNPYKMIMKKTQEHRTFPNHLNRQFNQLVPGKTLCTDITYLYNKHGLPAYLSAVKDIATNEIVSWKLSPSLTMPFVIKTLDDIPESDQETIIHSDQGVHYTHPEFIQKAAAQNLTQSMSRKANCIDNAPMESFFGHLKDEVEYKEAKTFQELNSLIKDYMKYYNTQRYQWNLKKMTPVEYRNHLLGHSAP